MSVGGVLATHDEVEQVRIGACEQVRENVEIGVIQPLEMSFEKRIQHEIELEEPAPATPADALTRAVNAGHTARFTMRSRILLIASVGLSPFGQTSAQFMIE